MTIEMRKENGEAGAKKKITHQDRDLMLIYKGGFAAAG